MYIACLDDCEWWRHHVGGPLQAGRGAGAAWPSSLAGPGSNLLPPAGVGRNAVQATF